MARLLVGALFASLAAAPAWALGADGHEAVCEIAYLELNDAAKARVDALIALERDEGIRSFRDGCVWPDFRGSLQNQRRSEHYINVPRHWTSIRYQKCHEVEACLFSAIQDDLAVLSSPFSSDEEKLIALKFLGHWVGDIHQPLHVSFADDRGGNAILVEGVAGCARAGRTKLHAVWDTCIPKDIMQALGASDVSPDDDDRAAFGALLRTRISDEQREAWRSSLSPLVWATESLAIARRQDVGYCIARGDWCDYSEDAQLYQENEHLPDDGMRVLEPDGDYEPAFSDEMTERLQAAGVRLGAVLNRILGQ